MRTNITKSKYFAIISMLLITYGISAQEWQWSTTICNTISEETNDYPQAFLWIPSNCKKVKAVVVGQHNMTEERVLEHPLFRLEMAHSDIAIIWITPGLDPLFDPEKGSQQQFEEMMNNFATISGYEELSNIPIIPIGHSAYASYPWNFAALNPSRTLAIVSLHGDSPQTHLTGCGRKNLDWDPQKIEGIPGLIIIGEYEWWEDRLFSAFLFRRDYPEVPLSLLCDAGRGHFDASEELIKYIGMFIRKVTQQRISKNGLLSIKASSGWLVDRWQNNTLPTAKAAPYRIYKGNRTTAFWYIDKEMAKITESYYENARNKTPQYIGFEQNGVLLPVNYKHHAKFIGNFLPDEDGVTFHINALFTDSTYQYRTNHFAAKEIAITRICGPVKKLNDSTFRLQFYRMGMNNPRRTPSIWLVGEHLGDEHNKSMVQQLEITIPYRLKKGIEQHISFPQISNVKLGTTHLTLQATASSGMKCYYYAKEGPIEIEDNLLTFKKIPPRAKFPIKVTVVAWQYGSENKRIQTAEPVEQTFYITK